MAKVKAARKEPIFGVKDAEGNSVEVDDKNRACVDVVQAFYDDGTEAEYVDAYDPCNVDCDDPCPPPKETKSVLGKHLKLKKWPDWIDKCRPLFEAKSGKTLQVKCDEESGDMYVNHTDNCVNTVQWNSGRVDVGTESSGTTYGEVTCIEFTNESACSINLNLMADFSVLYDHPPDSCYQQSLLLGLNEGMAAETPALEPGLCIPADGVTLVRNEAYSWQSCICLAAGETYKLCMKAGIRPSDPTNTSQPPYNFRAYQMSMKICPSGGGA